jgi:hypothetical protein
MTDFSLEETGLPLAWTTFSLMLIGTGFSHADILHGEALLYVQKRDRFFRTGTSFHPGTGFLIEDKKTMQPRY